MDLRLNEEQELLKTTARDFLARECPMSLVHALQNDPTGHSPELWGKMAELGWLGTAFPEADGGAGYGFVELCLLIEEQGRCRMPGPFLPTVVLCGLPIARFGSERQRAEHLPRIAAGEAVLACARSEGRATWGPEGIEMTARAQGDGYVLEGTKLFVSHAQLAHALLVPARTGGDGADGITVFLVDAAAPGVRITPQETVGADRPCAVTFSGVRVPAEHVLGSPGEGWPIVRMIDQWGAAALCAEMVGGAQRVLELSLDYAAQRTQFGRAIGSFQAIQHHCADMAVDVAASRYMAHEAIWRLAEGLEAEETVAVAKAWVSDAYRRVCALGHQVHGAIGFTREHDLHLYFRHAAVAGQAFGDGDHHREQVAQQLGL